MPSYYCLISDIHYVTKLNMSGTCKIGVSMISESFIAGVSGKYLIHAELGGLSYSMTISMLLRVLCVSWV